MAPLRVAGFAAAISLVGTALSPVASQQSTHYHIVSTLMVAPVGCDFLTLDTQNRKLYGIGNYVIDIDGMTVVGTLMDTSARGGFVVAPRLGRGVVRNGTIFDLASRATVGKVRVHGDASVYDSVSQQAFLLGDPTYAIDVREGRLNATVPLHAMPESGVADGAGHVYVNLADRDSIGMIETRSNRVTRRWGIAPCAGPMGMAMDRASRRLFVSCQMKGSNAGSHAAIAIVSADNGAVVGMVPVAGGLADQLAFDPGTKLLFSPSANDTMTVLHEDAPDRYSIVQKLREPQLQTHKIVVDEKTHRVFLPYDNPAGDSLGIVVLGP